MPYAWFSRESTDQQNWYKGTHAVISHFRGYLALTRSTGICLFDRPPQQVPDSGFPLLEALFLRGGDEELASGCEIKGWFPEITLFGITRNNASHLSSIADILVGGFRWCVNDRRNDVALEEMFPDLVELMWHKDTNGVMQVRNRGLIVRYPENPIKRAIKTAVAEFNGFLHEVCPQGWDILSEVPWEVPPPPART